MAEPLTRDAQDTETVQSAYNHAHRYGSQQQAEHSGDRLDAAQSQKADNPLPQHTDYPGYKHIQGKGDQDHIQGVFFDQYQQGGYRSRPDGQRCADGNDSYKFPLLLPTRL